VRCIPHTTSGLAMKREPCAQTAAVCPSASEDRAACDVATKHIASTPVVIELACVTGGHDAERETSAFGVGGQLLTVPPWFCLAADLAAFLDLAPPAAAG